MKKTWTQKLHNNKEVLPELKPITSEKLIEKTGEGMMVIPAPLEIDALMRSVPEGMVITTEQIRQQQNLKYNAVYTCPLCIGIFTRIAACASDEADPPEKLNPYWRTLKSKGEINEKFPGGVQFQIEKLQAEGHQIMAQGKKFFVKDFEGAVFGLGK